MQRFCRGFAEILQRFCRGFQENRSPESVTGDDFDQLEEAKTSAAEVLKLEKVPENGVVEPCRDYRGFLYSIQ